MGTTRLRPVGIVGAGLAAFATMIAGVGTASAAVSLDSESESFTFKPVERCFIRMINMKRRGHGMPRLQGDRDLGIVARRHSKEIARARAVRHDNNYGSEITRWTRLGQNTGRGNGCRSLFGAFWRSDVHRNNILGRWRHIGVGVKRVGGAIYVQQVFESKRNPGTIYT